jgi:tetratricopeptide (TPR) repeat protein
MKYNLHIRLLVILILFPLILWAQKERQYIREGYKAYMNEKYSDAEVAFQKAKNVDSTSFIASYNLGGSFYKSEKYEQAQNSYSKLIEADADLKEKAHLFYNLGNTQVKQALMSIKEQNMQEGTDFLKQALDSYKQSLLLNPEDKEAKYNYMLTKELLKKLQNKNQTQQEQQNQQNQEQEQDKQQEEKEGSEEKDQKQGGEDDQKMQKPEINKQDAELLLKIIEQKDEEILEKLKKIKAKKTDTKKEKDW